MNILDIVKSEGNYYEWTYVAKNEVRFRCFWRRHKSLKHLCGYVVLEGDSEFFGKHYDEIPVQVHGGLTYSEEEDVNWVIGFDCAHSGDLTPYFIESCLDLKISSSYGIYRDKNFVISECESLAEQISELSISKIREIKLGKLI